MDIHTLTHIHVCHSGIKALDHMSGTADEFQRFSAVIGRIELRAVIERSPIMGTAGFSYVLPFQGWFCMSAVAVMPFLAGAAVFSAGMAFTVMIAVRSGVFQFSAQISFDRFIRIP